MPQRRLRSSSYFRNRLRDAPTRSSAVRCQPGLTVCQRPLTPIPENGAFDLSPDSRANGAGGNPGAGHRRPQASRSGRRTRRRITRRPWRPRLAGGSRMGRRGAGRPTCNWRLPPITPLLEMAPSPDLRISGQMVLAPIPVSCPVAFSQNPRVEAVASEPIVGNHAREWRVVPSASGGGAGVRPAIGAIHPYEVSWKIEHEDHDTTGIGSGSSTGRGAIDRDEAVRGGLDHGVAAVAGARVAHAVGAEIVD